MIRDMKNDAPRPEWLIKEDAAKRAAGIAAIAAGIAAYDVAQKALAADSGSAEKWAAYEVADKEYDRLDAEMAEM